MESISEQGFVHRVLVADPLAVEGIELLQQHASVALRVDLSHQQLREAIAEYDALIVRSRTHVGAALIDAGRRLRVIGRAGTGVDNIDLEHATRHGIVVVNAPNGNTVAVAEHTMAMMLALARHIPRADASLRAGRWDKNQLLGTELRGKQLGIIGLGRVGTALARRAHALEMDVVACDPFVTVDHATRLNVQLLPLESLLRHSDIVSIHAPVTESTRGLIGAPELGVMKPTALLINCARGGIVDESALLVALEAGAIAGAALDVFEREPPLDNPLLACDRVIVTPHLGSATAEAQRSAAVDVARQVVDVLLGQTPRYPVNAPALSPEESVQIGPFMDLGQRMGRFYAQITVGNLTGLEIEYRGEVAQLNTELIQASVLAGLLSNAAEAPVNFINARVVARERGLTVSERRTPVTENLTSLLALRAFTTEGERSLTGTVMRARSRLVAIDGFWLDFVLEGLLLVTEHVEQPGIIGRMGTVLGQGGVNISFVQVGRRGRGGQGVMVIGVDDMISPELMKCVMALPSVRWARIVKV